MPATAGLFTHYGSDICYITVLIFCTQHVHSAGLYLYTASGCVCVVTFWEASSLAKTWLFSTLSSVNKAFAISIVAIGNNKNMSNV